MISTLFSNPIVFFVSLVSIVVAIIIHEFAHAWAADKLGDPTPRLQGRLTLNPVSHIDPIGMLLLFVIGFGWGRPVAFDPYNLKHPRRDAALISFAGPLSNFLLASICSILLYLISFFNLSQMQIIGYLLLIPFIQMNLVLGIFNLLPIHPLDGFKIVGGILPEEQAYKWYELQRFGYIFLLLLLFPFGGSSFVSSILRPAVSFFMTILIPGSL